MEILESEQFKHIEPYRVITINHIKFPDAEVGEDFAEDVVGGDGTGDGAQMMDALADVLAIGHSNSDKAHYSKFS